MYKSVEDLHAAARLELHKDVLLLEHLAATARALMRTGDPFERLTGLHGCLSARANRIANFLDEHQAARGGGRR